MGGERGPKNNGKPDRSDCFPLSPFSPIKLLTHCGRRRVSGFAPPRPFPDLVSGAKGQTAGSVQT